MRILADNILVKIEVKKTTGGGIIVTSDEQSSMHYAKVIQVGDYIDSNKIKVDNIVCFPKLTARKFNYKNEDFAIITENDVILVFENEAEI